MPQRNEIVSVYAAGVIQGVALVTFPAASTIFTSSAHYGLSTTEYGGMFVPQAITAIGSSLMGAGLTRRLGIKRIFLLGLAADLLAMVLLVLSQFVVINHPLAYGILLVATASMGVGFGLTVPAINTFAATFFPRTVDKAVLILNALLGLGTALAPIFVGLGIWWGLPVVVGALTVALLSFSFRLPLGEKTQSSTTEAQTARMKLPKRFWIFATFQLLYAICDTMTCTCASLYLLKNPC